MKKLVILFFILIAFVLPHKVFATGQIPDILIYKGETLSLFSNPLESYFGWFHPRPNKLFNFQCTACWRGYVATWKIENGYLYLTKLVDGSCGSDAKNIPLSKIFSNQEGPIKATWFTGNLKIPKGKQLSYVHMGYGSVYEKEIILGIEKGKIIKEDVIDNTKRQIPSSDERALEELKKLKEWEDKTVNGK